MSTEIVMLVVSLAYGIPSFVLYVIVIVQLIRPKCRKRFSNPFFRLCFLIGIVDCVAYLLIYLFFTLPTYSMFSAFYGSKLFSPSPFTTGAYFSGYFFSYLQLYGNCFLTLNRFTSIVFPTQHVRIWNYLFSISIVATVLSALAPCWHLTTTRAFYLPLFEDYPDQGYALAYDARKYPKFSNSFNMLVGNFVSCGLCLILNVVAGVTLVIYSSHTAAASKNRKAELNMFFLALILFGLQGISGIHQGLIHIARRTGNDMMLTVLYTMIPWISDLKFLSPPWVLVVISTTIRETVIQALPQRLLPYHKQSLIAGSIITVSSMNSKSTNARSIQVAHK